MAAWVSLLNLSPQIPLKEGHSGQRVTIFTPQILYWSFPCRIHWSQYRVPALCFGDLLTLHLGMPGEHQEAVSMFLAPSTQKSPQFSCNAGRPLNGRTNVLRCSKIRPDLSIYVLSATWSFHLLLPHLLSFSLSLFFISVTPTRLHTWWLYSLESENSCWFSNTYVWTVPEKHCTRWTHTSCAGGPVSIPSTAWSPKTTKSHPQVQSPKSSQTQKQNSCRGNEVHK